MTTKIGKNDTGLDATNLVTDLAAAIAATFAKAHVEGALITKTVDHHLLHEGYTFSAYFENTTAGSDLHHSIIQIKTPAASTEVHMVASFSASDAAFLFIDEAPAIDTADSTDGVAILNRNRTAGMPASLCLDNAGSPVVNKYSTWDQSELDNGNYTAGTIVRLEAITTGQGPKPAGGDAAHELILKPATKYLFALINDGSSSNFHQIYLDWFEVTL